GGADGWLAPAARGGPWAGGLHASTSPTGVRGDPWAGRPHASTSQTGGRPATPLRLGGHEGGSDEQCPAPAQADGDVAALATRMRCTVARLAVARLRRGRRRDVRRGSRRAGAFTRVLTADLHDDRQALGVRELVTDEDHAVLVLVDGVAADLDRVFARLEHLFLAEREAVLAHPHFRIGVGGVGRRRQRDQADGSNGGGGADGQQPARG